MSSRPIGDRTSWTDPPQHERRESNPQPPVLETGALPIELRSYRELGLGTSPDGSECADVSRAQAPSDRPGASTTVASEPLARRRSDPAVHFFRDSL